MGELIYEEVMVGLERITYDSPDWIFLGVDWKIYVLELYNWACNDMFEVVIFATDKEAALAVAADFLRINGEDFRWSEDEITEIENPRHCIAQTAKVENSRAIIDKAISSWIAND